MVIKYDKAMESSHIKTLRGTEIINFTKSRFKIEKCRQ